MTIDSVMVKLFVLSVGDVRWVQPDDRASFTTTCGKVWMWETHAGGRPKG